MLRKTIQQFFGDGALKWADISYVTDWYGIIPPLYARLGVVIACIWLFGWVANSFSVYERTFDIGDPLINHPSIKNDQVPSAVNNVIALWLPVVIMVIVGGLKRSVIEIHHGTIALCAGRGIARLITVLLKHQIGRLRPDFLSRCRWDEASSACTGKHHAILEGRKSFPSGHSSTAFAGMFFLALWLAGQTAAWCFQITTSPNSVLSSRLGRFILTLSPLFWATFVAISRVQDYKHHKEDVIFGSLIGVLSATVAYLIFWPNPLSAKTFSGESSGRPRLLYAIANVRRSDIEFQTIRTEADEMEDV